MTLLDQAALDLRLMLEGEFSVVITITNPSGATAVVRGQQTHIGERIDAGTGLVVSGNKASVALPLAALADAGIGIPRAITDSAAKPWLVAFASPPDTTVRTFKVTETAPDKLGCLVCHLEAYKQ